MSINDDFEVPNPTKIDHDLISSDKIDIDQDNTHLVQFLEEYNNLREILRVSQDKLLKTTSEVHEQVDKLKELENKVAEKHKLNDDLLIQKNDHENIVNKNNSNMNTLQDEIKEKEILIEELKNELSQLDKELIDGKSTVIQEKYDKLKEYQIESSKLTEQSDDLKIKLGNIREKNIKIANDIQELNQKKKKKRGN